MLKSSQATHADLIRIAPEKNTIKIETIRDLLSRVMLKPVQAERMVIIIEEADAMTTGAANALLKTLEEPPAYVLFLLLTSRPEELPATIRSRCQRVRLQIPNESLRKNLSELYGSLEAELAPLFGPSRTPFATASKLAEAVTAESEKVYPCLELLKALWHDVAILRGAGTSQALLLPALEGKLSAIAGRKGSETIADDLDLILETERAIDGNVHKALALERLFYRLMT